MDKASRTVFFVVAFFLIISCVGKTNLEDEGKCKTRADCHMKCEFGLPTCVGGICVCLATKTYSTSQIGETCKTKDDCLINCKGGIPFCVEARGLVHVFDHGDSGPISGN
ncbi:uncharacterized protein LOC132066212 [Lycium ferocissimum]|uniref:uncharacterized protein LOC132066212 n=1 Tax=Lycium ferocissimum TaxID=112874 RepID=UPI002815CC8F|nr:uncharacterized protein LOC132066212 [Lycium ferocissimum]